MSDPRIERAYQQQLARRAKLAAMNEAKGRSLGNIPSKGIPLEGLDKSNAAATLSDVVDQMSAKHNLENTVKKADGFDPRIDANVRNNPLKNAKGFAKLLPMLGLGGTALAASSIFNKANAGDIPGASMEALDEVTDYVPGVGTAKMALQADELGAGEDEMMRRIKAQQKSQASAKDEESRRFEKIKMLMGG